MSHKMKMYYIRKLTYFSYFSLHGKKKSCGTVPQSDKPKSDSVSHGRFPSSFQANTYHCRVSPSKKCRYDFLFINFPKDRAKGREKIP